jgi:hypothetical protein
LSYPQLPLSRVLDRYPPPICTYDEVKSVESNKGETRIIARVVSGPSDLGQQLVPRAIHQHDQSLSVPESHYTGKRMNPLAFPVRSLTHNEKTTSREANFPETRGQLRRQGKTRESMTKEEQTSDYVHFCLHPYLLRLREVVSTYGCPGACDGHLPIIVQPFPPIPIDNTGRNAELFYFCMNISLFFGLLIIMLSQFIMSSLHTSALSMDVASRSSSEIATSLGWRNPPSWHTVRSFPLLVFKLRREVSMSQHRWKR